MARAYRKGRNVTLGPGAKVGPYVVLGQPPGKGAGVRPLVIGRNATLRSHSVLYLGTRIGDRFQTGHGTIIRENAVIGDDVSVGSHSEIAPNARIGDGVRIHSHCFVAEFVEVQDKAWLGPRVTILNVPHPPCPSWEECASGDHRVVIGNGAKVGGGAVIGPWVKVGAGSLVGAGSVVIRDVRARTVVAGNPARAIRKVSDLECGLGRYDTPYEWEEKK